VYTARTHSGQFQLQHLSAAGTRYWTAFCEMHLVTEYGRHFAEIMTWGQNFGSNLVQKFGSSLEPEGLYLEDLS